MVTGMSENSKKQQALQDMDDWTASNRGQIMLFLPLAGLVLYGLFVIARDLF